MERDSSSPLAPRPIAGRGGDQLREEQAPRNVFVFGATGMVGQAVFRRLAAEPAFTTWGTYRDEAHRSYFPPSSISSGHLIPFHVEAGASGIEAALNRPGNCAAVINCIALLKSEIDEQSAESVRRAELLNTDFPLRLAEATARRGIPLLHISTDGVFSADAPTPSLEDHAATADDVYGRTKRQGEPDTETCVTIRTSFIGRDPIRGKGLMEWFLRQPRGAELRGFSDVWWSGVTTNQFAECCALLASADNLIRLRKESRIQHFCPNTATTKYELLELFKRIFNKELSISPVTCPGGPQQRILGTKYQLLRKWCGAERPLEPEVARLRESEESPHDGVDDCR